MKRYGTYTQQSCLIDNDIGRETAIHEAGHAASIYLGNKQNELPSVTFRILINPLNCDFQSTELSESFSDGYFAKLEGGRLIKTLPSSTEEAAKCFSTTQRLAFERDIINLLAGPLAEAKYVALRDNELFNHKLVNLNALHFYGGLSDLEIVDQYLDFFIDNDVPRETKIAELFLAAFNFINEKSNWLTVTALADYILDNEKNIIEFDEIIAVLENDELRTKS